MKLSIIAAAFACLAVPSMAQSATPPSQGTIGKPHICDEAYYPADALSEGRGGDTIVAFTITDQGTVADPKVARSSGHPDLDVAALACVKHWRYRPALKDSIPVAVPWRASVSWRFDGDTDPYVVAYRKLLADSWICLRRSAVAHALPRDFEGTMTVNYRFKFLVDPVVTITQSSGDVALDRAMIDCTTKSPWLSAADKLSGMSPGGTSPFAWYPGLAQ
jgi:TonB family protein